MPILYYLWTKPLVNGFFPYGRNVKYTRWYPAQAGELTLIHINMMHCLIHMLLPSAVCTVSEIFLTLLFLTYSIKLKSKCNWIFRRAGNDKNLNWNWLHYNSIHSFPIFLLLQMTWRNCIFFMFNYKGRGYIIAKWE